MYEVAALRYGTRETRKSECYYRWDSYGEPDAPIGMDYFFWVLRNGGETIVVDTGFHPDVGARRGRTLVCAAGRGAPADRRRAGDRRRR